MYFKFSKELELKVLFKGIFIITYIALVSNTYAQDKRWSTGLSYSLFDMWIPGKIGASVSYGDDKKKYNFEYQKMAYNFDFFVADLGEVSDSRYTFALRSFSYNNSFNYYYGVTLNKVHVQLGSSWYADLGARYDAISVTTFNFMWGVGNQIQFSKNFYFEIDWVKVYFPLFITDKQTDILEKLGDENKEKLDDMIDSLSSIPTMTLLQVGIGYRF